MWILAALGDIWTAQLGFETSPVSIPLSCTNALTHRPEPDSYCNSLENAAVMWNQVKYSQGLHLSSAFSAWVGELG